MTSRERLTVSLPADMASHIRSATGEREVSAYIERAVRHEMIRTAPYPAVPTELQDDLQVLSDEARGWTSG